MPATANVLKHVVVALDKNATLLLELTIHSHLTASSNTNNNTSAGPSPAASSWLLLHGIPVTSGLSHTLMRLLNAEVAASASHASTTETSLETCARAMQDESNPLTLSFAGLTSTPLPPPSAVVNPIIELVRVCFVVSEIHAYALIIKCTDAAQAAVLKSVLSQATAPGVVIPVESVHGCGRVRRVPATSSAANEESQSASAVARVEGKRMDEATLLPPSITMSNPSETAEDAGTMCGLWDAVTLNLATSAMLPSAKRRRRGPSNKATVIDESATAAAERSRERGSPLTSYTYTTATTSTMTAATSLSHVVPPPSPGLSASPSAVKDEWCAICQVEPLAAQACVVTLCQHVFHLHCYAKLPSTSADCPLCRFSLYDLLSDVRCEVCHTSEDLWGCLICGFVGCGTGRRSHQQAHSEHTGHSCAMQASTHRIWNTRSRMFLHQEVAMMLDRAHDNEDTTNTTATSSEQEKGEAMAQRRHAEAVRTLWARPAESDEDAAQDEMLQAALNESMEDLVQRYYTGVLRSLLEEQEKWYESRMAETTASANTLSIDDKNNSDDKTSATARVTEEATQVQLLVQAEQAARHRLVMAHVKSMREMFAVSDMELRTMLRRQRGLQEELLEQVLLESHHNSALQKNIGKLRQKIAEAQARGALAAQKAAEKEQELQARVEAALSDIP